MDEDLAGSQLAGSQEKRSNQLKIYIDKKTRSQKTTAKLQTRRRLVWPVEISFENVFNRRCYPFGSGLVFSCL